MYLVALPPRHRADVWVTQISMARSVSEGNSSSCSSARRDNLHHQNSPRPSLAVACSGSCHTDETRRHTGRHAKSMPYERRLPPPTNSFWVARQERSDGRGRPVMPSSFCGPKRQRGDSFISPGGLNSSTEDGARLSAATGSGTFVECGAAACEDPASGGGTALAV